MSQFVRRLTLYFLLPFTFQEALEGKLQMEVIIELDAFIILWPFHPL